MASAAGAPQARGKALINLLPLQQDEYITTIMPLPEDETTWASLNVMFATSAGDVRRNDLSDFVEVRQNGKIAMKLDEGTQIVGVDICTENDNVLLTTAGGQAIRFPVGDVRVFKGRESTGVRGVRLDADDQVISMAILRHVDAAPAERAAYVKQANAIRRAATGDRPAPEDADMTPEEGADGAEDRGSRRSVAGALRRTRRIGAVRADGLGKRLRQAHQRL